MTEAPTELKMNLNDRVRVRLTPHGVKVRQQYRDRFANLANLPGMASFWKDDTEEVLHLWELMNIYGHATFMGATGPFEGNEIVLVSGSHK